MKKPKKPKNPIAQAMTAMRNAKLTPKRRAEIASNASKQRWKLQREREEEK